MNDFLIFVTSTNTSFFRTSDNLIAQIRDATKEFTVVLANPNTFLEHAILLDLVADCFPKA